MANFRDTLSYTWNGMGRNFKHDSDVRRLVICLAVFAIGCGTDFVKREAKREAAQRAHEFADYVIADVREYASDNKTKQAVREAVANYKYDQKFWNEYILELIADSTKYANAIVRDSWIINKLSPTISFRDALDWLDDRSASKYKIEHNTGVSHGEEVVKSVSYVPSGKTVVKGSNKSEEYKMKVDLRYLKEISTKLAVYRAAQNRVHKNQGR